MVEQTEQAAPEVDLEVAAKNFAAEMADKLEPEQLDAAVEALRSTTTGYAANGSVVSAIFYLKFQVRITSSGGKTFNGDGGGISTPGAGALMGTVFTDDLDRLYRDTRSFSFQGTPVYLGIEFFDGSSRLIGHYQGGAVSIVSGVGGGSGRWS